MAAAAMRVGLRVCEATSSGPAASAIPSPMLPTQVDARFHRKGTPIRGGAMRSMIRRTGDTRRH